MKKRIIEREDERIGEREEVGEGKLDLESELRPSTTRSRSLKTVELSRELVEGRTGGYLRVSGVFGVGYDWATDPSFTGVRDTDIKTGTTTISILSPVLTSAADPSTWLAKRPIVVELSLSLAELRKEIDKVKVKNDLRPTYHNAGTFTVAGHGQGMKGGYVYLLEDLSNEILRKALTKGKAAGHILEKVKSEVDGIKPVSWADMIAVAGAEAVSICGGPFIPIQLGRVDSLVPDPEGKLPEESLNASELKKCFRTKGFSTQELVALSGAHTIGSKGFGSPVVFDNSYYKILLEKPWMTSGGMSSMIGLPSDRALSEDGECLRWVRLYADDENKFFEDFKSAYIKLVNSGATWKKS
ncbi:hypothetical protein Sjap_011164 [Stephania japonica]|uniref:L-ascorbate peroxidase n=1 Tax=Stephania japonica TaxID=461633 RepID=A0AAP0JAJ9_9MAGN